jgi:cytochrome oxidase Cu insertion factor (SCO1/SenC/PrrC family)
MQKSITISLLLSIATALLTWLVFFQSQAIANRALPTDLYGHITPFQLPDVALQTQHTDRTDWLELADKPLFITTGFTSCHDICPMTMAFYQRLSKSVGETATLAFLTIDPKTDTPTQLKDYLAGFGSEFVGVRIEDPNQLNNTLQALKQSFTLSKSSEFLEHQGYIYLMHPKVDGLLVYTDAQPDPIKIRTDLLKLDK